MRAIYMLGITLAAVIGCGGSHTSQARRAVFVASEAVIAADAEIAREYAQASDEAVQIADTVPEYRRLMAPWNEAETTLRMLRAAVLTAELEVDRYDRTGERLGMIHGIGCVIVLAENLFREMHELGLTGSGQLMAAAQALKPFGGICNDGLDQ